MKEIDMEISSLFGNLQEAKRPKGSKYSRDLEDWTMLDFMEDKNTWEF